jgi:hypothetical protein
VVEMAGAAAGAKAGEVGWRERVWCGGGVVEAWGEVLQAGREARRAGQVFMYYVG